MEHAGEIWQEYDARGERVMNGGLIPGNPVQEGNFYGGTAVMLYRVKDGNVEFLFQHRSKLLRGNPGKWDVSTGGHINYNESKIDSAIREAKEEIGVDLEKQNLELAAYYVRENNYVCLYFYDFTFEKDEFSFDDNEVEEVKWVKFEDFEAFRDNLKTKLKEDEVFTIYLDIWAKKIKAEKIDGRTN